MERKIEPDVIAITTARLTIERADNQHFATTPKAWELWQTEPARMLKRWSRNHVFFIVEQRP